MHTLALADVDKTQYMLSLARKIGFSHTGLFSAKVLSFRLEVRDMCKSGNCGCDGVRWTCPPYCGTLEESASKAQRFTSGILLQMTGEMEDDSDKVCIQRTEQAVKDKLCIFAKRLREQNIDFLPMSAGTCTRCSKCTCPDEPCRFPDEIMISMEAYGLIVMDVCAAAGVNYKYGPKTITFTTCVLY